MSRKLKIVELLQNASFLKWLREGQPPDGGEWQKWETKGSENRSLVKDAADMERGIPFRRQQLEKSQSQEGWRNIEARIKAEEKPTRPYHRQIGKLAAAMLLLIVAGLAINWYLQRPQWITVKTAFGETKTILLPDDSEIILGANSELTYDEKLAKRAKREVALNGEAFFKVKRSDHGAPFSVALNDIYVEVLGTSFNVSAYHLNAIVSLVEGSLRLSKQQEGEVGTNEMARTSILLEPGQTAWFDEDQQDFVLVSEQTDYWTSWIDKEWSFGTGTPLATVLEKIKVVYGLEAVVKDPSILDQQLAGKVSIESADVLFESLAVLLDLKITRKGQQLIIE